MRTWRDVERALCAMLAEYNGSESRSMRALLERTIANVNAGYGERLCSPDAASLLDWFTAKVSHAAFGAAP